MISVVFSAINCSETVRAAVLSTLKSLGRRGEVVFHLDPSSDDSLEVLSDISDPRFRLLPTKESLGFAGGLNYAINESKYELVARMDADDICLPWRFHRQLAVIERTRVDALFSTAIVFGKSVRPFGVFPQLPLNMSPKQAPAELLLRNPFVHPTLLVRKTALMSVGGYRKAIAEDYDLFLRMACQGLALSRDWLPSVMYRIHSSQATFDSAKWSQRVSSDALTQDSLRQLALVGDSKIDIGNKSIRLGDLWLKLERKGLKIILNRSTKD